MSPHPLTYRLPRHSPIVCDVCDSSLGGARVLCMDCHDKTTIDLCPEPDCLKSTVTLKKRKDLTAPHKPNHSMLKVHRIVFDRDTGRAEKNAKDALEAARETLSDLKAQKKPTPQCVHCKETVSQPCWFCVDCTSEFRGLIVVPIITPLTQHPFSQRRGSSATTANLNVSPSTTFTPKSTSSSGSSRRLSKRLYRQKIDCEPSRGNLNPYKTDS